eukprot:Skav218264  [mRNA]  locus=scaffold2035:196687:217330:- [translate_table: standard]
MDAPSNLPYELPGYTPGAGKFGSQAGQDAWVDKVFNGQNNLFLVESGANDGIFQSNSIFLETERKWDCLLVEANPYLWGAVRSKHRKCYFLTAGLSMTKKRGDFPFTLGGPFGGFTETLPSGHWHWMDEFRNKNADFMRGSQGNGKQINVSTFPLYQVLQVLNRTTVDYWSLDTEGSELQILKGSGLEHFELGVLTVEHLNHDVENRQSIKAFLEQFGLERVVEGKNDDYYANPKYFSRRNLPFPFPKAVLPSPAPLSEVSAPAVLSPPAGLPLGLSISDFTDICLAMDAPSNLPYELPGYTPGAGKFGSQAGQDAWVDKVFNGQNNLFLVESGANDGIFQSNSIFLETERKWDCLLVEANPYLWGAVRSKHRKCYFLTAGLSMTKKRGDFPFTLGGPFGGFTETLPSGHWHWMDEFRNKNADFMRGSQGNGKQINVSTFPLYQVLQVLNRTTVDYWSLDTEGSELQILKGSGLEHFELGVLTVEHLNHDVENRQSIKAFLEQFGLARVVEGKNDDYYANPKYFSRRNLPFPFPKAVLPSPAPLSEVSAPAVLSPPAGLPVGLSISDFTDICLAMDAPSNLPYELPGYTPGAGKFGSQAGQDAWVDKVFNGQNKLFLVESGANDGIFQSNSIFLETERKWDCLLVEANPYLWGAVRSKHRKCYFLTAGLSMTKKRGDFPFTLGGPFGGFTETLPSGHWHWMDEFRNKNADFMRGSQGNGKQINVSTFPLYQVLQVLNRTTVDYWSLDTEGSELQILKGSGLEHFELGVLTVEHLNHDVENRQSIKAFLEQFGLERVENVIKRNQVEHTKTERNVLEAVSHPFIVTLHYAFQTPKKPSAQLGRILPDLAWKGFDAIQIPPAQVCHQGARDNAGLRIVGSGCVPPKVIVCLPGDLRKNWYLRYQPVNYQHIDPALGTAQRIRSFKLPRANHHGRWWRVDVPLRSRCSVEFVLNDGSHSWDNHPSALGNYIAELPGLHILVDKKLAMLSKVQGRSSLPIPSKSLFLELVACKAPARMP